jgi:acyl-CoA synthetase (AMP-forming)/AMP-acid ligase II
METPVNVAAYLPLMAARHPFRRAVVFPAGLDRQGRRAYLQRTFAQLESDSNRLARGFAREGITRGTRTAMMVRPSLDFAAITFALFKLGAVPVFVDPGMGLRAMLECFREATPQAFIGIKQAHLVRQLFRGAFRSVRVAIDVSGLPLLGGLTLEQLRASSDDAPHPIAPTTSEETAAIFYTSGSTGVPKGVPFTHGMIQGQVSIQQRTYSIGDDEIDLVPFPVFVLFSTAFGATAVIPRMDPTRPARVDPAAVVEAIRDQGVTHSFGSPAIWHRVGAYCEERGLSLPSVRRILMAGAPVPPKLLARWRRILPNGEVHTPYGATECLGVATICAREVLEETWALGREGRGTCVGRPIPETRVRIIRISDQPERLGPDGWKALDLPEGQVGEITVQGPLAARTYLDRPEATAQAKIEDGDGFWHRMGDLGYFDGQGRLWFCGRKAHRVERAGELLCSVMVEGRFNSLEGIHRTALVGVPAPGAGTAAVLVVEPEPGCKRDRTAWGRELVALAGAQGVPLDHVLFHPGFPVDVRHNAKIRREELAVWAASRLRLR